MTENKAVYIVSGEVLDAFDADYEATIASLRTDVELLKAELVNARQERDTYAAAGYEAATMASNALNLEAQLTARLAESVASVQGEIITRMSKQHAAEVTRWQTICLRQAEAVAWLFAAIYSGETQNEARRLFPDVLGEETK